MLVLTRKLNQKIRIGENIFVTIVEVRDDGQVKIGVEAPKDTAIWREEIDNQQGAKK